MPDDVRCSGDRAPVARTGAGCQNVTFWATCSANVVQRSPARRRLASRDQASQKSGSAEQQFPLPGTPSHPVSQSSDVRPVEPWSPAATPANGRVVLFSQIKECANIIESFVSHYAAIGFYKLLLYLDDPLDVAKQVLEESGWIDVGFVELVEVNEELSAVWPSLPSWDRVGSFAKMEVQSRQILNNEHAMQRCKQLGADWLVHLDSDELLCLPEAAPAFFAGLAARGCSMYIFNNLEGVPEACDSADVLRSIRLFKQNLGNLPRTPEAGLAMFDWQLKLGGYFFSYENGKCAVNVKYAKKCLSVCMWEVAPQIEPGKSSQPDGSTCTWWTNNKRLWDGAVKHRKDGLMHKTEEVPRLSPCPDAFILHFCVCEFSAFWRKRWTQLGYLSASDQFRVRSTSGATMARFYRLQREGCQAEARKLYSEMCVLRDRDALAKQISAGVLVRADPQKLCGDSSAAGYGISASGWVPARRPVRYDELAAKAEARGAHFDAWLLMGKALESQVSGGARQSARWHRQRASSALAAGLASCANADSAAALELGDLEAWLPHVEALEALGLVSAAVDAAKKGLAALDGVQDLAGDVAALLSMVSVLEDRLNRNPSEGDSAGSSKEFGKLPTVKELQEYVARAVRPDVKDSPLYRSVLAVAMSWWQEVGGDAKLFPNTLARTAITARTELAAAMSAVKPRPVRQIRQVWDLHEDELKRTGAMAADIQQDMPFWVAVSRLLNQLLGTKESTVVKGCDKGDSPMACIYPIFEGLIAEINRTFDMTETLVVTEMRISRPRQSTPEIDNGGLLPDNRREVSLRLFVPADAAAAMASRSTARLTLGTRDGEQALSFELTLGRVFLWWSRQTFHQVLDGDAFFQVSTWGVIPQKFDRPQAHRAAYPVK